MPHNHLERFIVLFFVGLGLLLVGGVNFALRRLGQRQSASHTRNPDQNSRAHPGSRVGGFGRLLATLAICGLVLAVAWASSPSTRVVWGTAKLLAIGVLPCLLLGSPWLTSAVAAVAGLLRRPAVHWGLASLAGLGTIIASVAVFQSEDEAALETGTQEVDLMGVAPPRSGASSHALTDHGTQVGLEQATESRSADQLQSIEAAFFQKHWTRDFIIHRHPGDDRSNCHGWVFTGGRYWIPGAHVDLILRENGYQEVTKPQPGDLVVYRTAGAVAHSALVRYISKGMPVLVEGKWGFSGVYLHPVEKSPYGMEFLYYRSPRGGHLLAGLDLSTAPGAGGDTDPPAEAETE